MLRSSFATLAVLALTVAGSTARAQDLGPVPASAPEAPSPAPVPPAPAPPAPAAPAEPSEAKAPPVPVPPAEEKPKAASRAVDVDDMSLDELLERDLDDRLGTTKAVSRRSESVLTAPLAITTITAEEIRLSGARTVPDLLRWVPGVQVYRNAPGNYIVALRGTGGLNGNNVVVTLNGVQVNSPLDASVDWDLVPVHVADIERIEVVRGPVSTTYGANAYTGIINIVTREAYGTTSAGAVRLEGGADFEPGPLGATSGRWLLNGQTFHFSSFASAEYDGTQRATDEGDAPALVHGGALARLEWLPNPESEVAFDIGGSRSTRSSLDHLVLESNPQTRSLAFAAIRAGTHPKSGAVRTMEVWARTALQVTETDASEYIGFSYAETRSNRAAVGTDLAFDVVGPLTLNAGVQGDLDWVDAPYVSASANDRLYTGYGFYGGMGLAPLGPLHITLGARGDVPPATQELQFSYRGSIVADQESWAVRLTAASAYRAPSYVELGGRFVDPASGLLLLEGAPGLDPPRNETLEAGLIAAPFESLRIAPTVFLARLKDVIVEDFDPLVRRTFTNDRRDRTVLGTEIEADWAVTEEFGIAAHFASLHWLSVDESVTATVGVPEQSASWAGGGRIHGTLLRERFGYGLGASLLGSREFALRAGIPPRIIDASLSTRAHVYGMAEYNLGLSLPLWVSLRVFGAVPYDRPESPLGAAASTTVTSVAGVELRQE